jgi:hypothetical protein
MPKVGFCQLEINLPFQMTSILLLLSFIIILSLFTFLLGNINIINIMQYYSADVNIIL